MSQHDQQIVQACQDGDMEQFTQLYDRYYEQIYKYIYYRTSHQQTAEDLTSQAFMQALEKINSFKMGQGTFSAWLYRIAKNLLIDHYRTKREKYDLSQVLGLSSDEDIQHQTEVKQQLEQVRKYLQQLSSDQQEIVTLRLWDGLSYQEVADTMNKSEASCKMAFSRAMRKIRAEFVAVLLLLISIWQLI